MAVRVTPVEVETGNTWSSVTFGSREEAESYVQAYKDLLGTEPEGWDFLEFRYEEVEDEA